MTLRDECHRALSCVQLQSHCANPTHALALRYELRLAPGPSTKHSAHAAVEGKDGPLGPDSAWDIDGVLSGEDPVNGKQ